ncbi:MAG: GntR family transcriptional regulator [Actinomycetota bacterium]|nr:GntR family transcriptional regulator [Actinomycetota bacterium]
MGATSLGGRKQSLGRTLAEKLRGRIVAGEFPAGGRLPSEAEIGAEYEVSRVTVRAALQLLESRGLVDVRHGAGSFVSNHGGGIRAGLQELRSITETIREMGFEPTMERRVLELRPATEHEAERLAIEPGDEVWSIERAVNADGEAVAYSYDVIPTSALPAPARRVDGTVDLRGEQLGNGSVFAALESAGLISARALAEIHAASSREVGSHHADDDDEGRLYLLLDQLHEDRSGLPIAYSRTYFVEGRFQFVVLRTR